MIENCPFELINKKWTCSTCGWIYPLKAKEPPKRNCPNALSRGLGDTIARIVRKLGIKPCGGCKKRRTWLNRIFPYKNKQDS